MPDPYDTANRLAAEAAKLEKERDQLKKELSDTHEQLNWDKVAMSEARIVLQNTRSAVVELYDLRKAVYDLHGYYHGLSISIEQGRNIWGEIDRLMGDWSPGKDHPKPGASWERHGDYDF